MRAIIIPADEFDAFNFWIVPNIWRVGPVQVHTGPHAGKLAINAEIIHASVEFERDNHKRGPIERTLCEAISKRSRGEHLDPAWNALTLEVLEKDELIDPKQEQDAAEVAEQPISASGAAK